jgi:hypothetical protein
MKLTYRSVDYDYEPPKVEIGFTDDVGKYRGVDIRFRAIKKMPVHPLKVNLMYRGAAYTAGESLRPNINAALVESPIAAAPTLSPSNRLRALSTERVKSIQRREQSMLTREAEKVGLTAEKVGQHNGTTPGNVRHDFTSYERSQSTMS